MMIADRRFAVTERQRDVLMDLPLTREKKAVNWVGARGIHHRHLVQKLIDRRLITLDIDNDPFGRTATITDEGRQLLLSA
jgi:hypothetical protein